MAPVVFFFHHVNIVVGNTTFECSFFCHLEDGLAHNEYRGTCILDMMYELVNLIGWIR